MGCADSRLASAGFGAAAETGRSGTGRAALVPNHKAVAPFQTYSTRSTPLFGRETEIAEP